MRLLLVDDHVMFREGLQMLLAECNEPVDVLHAGSLAEAERLLDGTNDIDLILLDLSLPDGSGLATIDVLRNAFEQVPVVVLSSTDDARTMIEAIDHGAMGYVPKALSFEVMRGALGIVLAGGVYLPAAALAAPGAAAGLEHGADGDGTTTPEQIGLTPRQGEVLQQILEGKPVKMIARSLGMTQNTAKSHVSAVLRTLRVANRTQAVITAMRMGLRLPRKP